MAKSVSEKKSNTFKIVGWVCLVAITVATVVVPIVQWIASKVPATPAG